MIIKKTRYSVEVFCAIVEENIYNYKNVMCMFLTSVSLFHSNKQICPKVYIIKKTVNYENHSAPHT